jgi:hypothetical protein
MLRPAFVTTFSAASLPLSSYTSSFIAELVSSTTTNDNISLSTTIIRRKSQITMASSPSTSLSSAYSPDDTTTRVFEAIGPDPSVLVTFGIVVLVCIAAGYVWANDVVPVSRTKLAISKNRGDVRDYLDSLRPPDPGITVTEEEDDRVEGMHTILDESAQQQLALSSTTTTTLSDAGDGDSSSSIVTTTKDQPQRFNRNGNNIIVKPNVGDGRDFERWLFTDWLNKPNMSKVGRRKEPALPILKDAKWNSGDNPVLVTAAIMMLGVVVASITERIAT